GRKVTERLEAESADEVLQTLRDQGYTDVVLHTDDVSAQYTRQSAVSKHISPREYVAFRRFRGHFDHTFFLLRKLLVSSWLILLCSLGLLAVRRGLGLPWGFLDYVAVVVLVFPLVWAVASQFFRTGTRYRRLITEGSWGRWEEVLRLRPNISEHLPREEAAFREAQALAGLGRLDEALRRVRPYGGGVRMPEWLYWARLGGVYSTAKDKEQHLACLERA